MNRDYPIFIEAIGECGCSWFPSWRSSETPTEHGREWLAAKTGRCPVHG